MADNWLSSTPSYEGIAEAMKKKLNEDEVARQRQIQQAIGVRGIRTSGIGLYPSQEAGRVRGNEEANIYSSIGGQQLGNIFTASESAKDRDLYTKLEAMREAAAATAAKRSRQATWSSSLWGIPMGLATGGMSSALKGLISKWQNKDAYEDTSDGQITIG